MVHRDFISATFVALLLACNGAGVGGDDDTGTHATGPAASTSATELPTTSTSAATTDADDPSTSAGTTGADAPDLLIPCPPIPADSQPDLDDDGIIDTVLSYQAEVTKLAGCTDIAGSLYVQGDLITDLTALASLRRIGRSLSIDRVPITSLHGLEDLTTIGANNTGASIHLTALPGLTSLDPLAGVQWNSPQELQIMATGISDLNALAFVEELSLLWLAGNPQLTSLASLKSLTAVGYLYLNGTALTDIDLPVLAQPSEAYIINNDNLSALSCLSGTTSLVSLHLASNPALTDLPELAQLASVAGNLYIRASPGITDLDDLGALTHVGGRLVVSYNPALLQTDAEAWAAPIQVDGARKIVANKGYDVPPLDPCPWPKDGECDEPVCDAWADHDDCIEDD